jgi:hypothetical protein
MKIYDYNFNLTPKHVFPFRNDTGSKSQRVLFASINAFAAVVGDNMLHRMFAGPFAPSLGLLGRSELRCLIGLIRKKTSQILVNRKTPRLGWGGNLRVGFGAEVFKWLAHLLHPPVFSQLGVPKRTPLHDLYRLLCSDAN